MTTFPGWIIRKHHGTKTTTLDDLDPTHLNAVTRIVSLNQAKNGGRCPARRTRHRPHLIEVAT